MEIEKSRSAGGRPTVGWHCCDELRGGGDHPPSPVQRREVIGRQVPSWVGQVRRQVQRQAGRHGREREDRGGDRGREGGAMGDSEGRHVHGPRARSTTPRMRISNYHVVLP